MASQQMTYEEEEYYRQKYRNERCLKNAEIAYTTYYESIGGDSFPAWEEFSSDTSKQKQVNAWIEVAKAFYQGMPIG